jgi:RND family efflux transporter MFP subunit
MNYEAKVADLSGAESVLIDDVELETRRGRRRRTIIIAAIVVALLVIGAWMLSGGEEEAAFAPEEEGTAPAVTVVAPGRTTVAGIINATGTLAARREMPVGVVGEGGRVVAVNFEAGDWVRAGEVMVVIDRSVQSQQALSSAAQIEVARADASLAQANLDRALQLVDRGFISKADVDRLTATRDAARARVRVAEAQYRELLARNARLNIVAPAAGLVLERNVEIGQIAGAGTALASIARGGEMELLTQLGEADLAAVPVGAIAEILPVGTDKAFTCTVWQKAPVISEQTRQGTARCALSYAPELRPGGFATAKLNSGAVVAPMLPESAIQSDDKGSYVYIIDANNKVLRRPIQLGMVTDEGIAIASGLNGTERVVVRAAGFLTVGDTVRPVIARN